MNMILRLSAPFLLSALAAGGAVSAKPAQAQPPNVVLILTDDQGYGDVGVHGNGMIRTPNLDRLHGESARFTNFHVDPTCSPTRAALLTGRYSTRTGVWHTIMGRSLMYHDEVTMADVFRRQGYKTGMFGKWHLGDNFPTRPQDRGFEEVLTFGGGGIGQTPDYWGNDYFDDTLLHNGILEPYTGYCTDVFFENALKFIEKNRDEPFFVFIPTNVPHSPYNVAERYSKPYKDRGVPDDMADFYGMIENMDENLGRLRERLDSLNLSENTILIFMSDNGTSAGAPNKTGRKGGSSSSWQGFNAGMRATKGSEYDGGHRVPFFVRWPAGGITKGRNITPLTAHIDLLPTLAEWCRLPLPAAVALDGRSLAPLLRKSTEEWPERTLFVHVQREEIPPKWTKSAVMTDRWRLANGAELYDMTSDPGQKRDVAPIHPDVVTELRGRYEEWWAGLTPSFDRYARIPLGTPEENPTELNCMDWHGEGIPWNQSLIMKSPWVNGVWMVDVVTPGHYQFTLRSRPATSPQALEASIARVRIGEREASISVPADATNAVLELEVPKGPAPLQTWLDDETGRRSRGAFYLEVKRLD